MAHDVRLATRAIQDAATIMRQLRRRSRTAADRWHFRLVEAVLSLEHQPHRCGLAPEAEIMGIEIRHQLFGKRPHVYRILFTVTEQLVNVLHIRHAARRPWGPRQV